MLNFSHKEAQKLFGHFIENLPRAYRRLENFTRHRTFVFFVANKTLPTSP